MYTLYYVMCFDRMDPARCSAVAVIQPVSELLPPRNLRLDCGWPNIARPALRCATNLSVVRWLCRSEFKRVFSMQNSLRSPRPQGTGRNSWETADALERHGGFSVVPVLSQSKTGTTVLSCGNISEYFSEYQSVEQGSMRDCEWSAHSRSQSRIDPCRNVRHYQ